MGDAAYIAVTFELEERHEDQLADILTRYRVLGSELAPHSGDSLKATVFLRQDECEEADDLAEEVRAIAVGGVETDRRDSEDWLAAYREGLRAFALGATWWIDPDPERPTPAPDGRRRLVIEPRMAFGSGSHPSTHLILLELEERPPENKRVLDIGTGSGILSLAGNMLGASWTVGLDIDLQAVIVAHECVADQDEQCVEPTYLAGPLDAIAGARFGCVLCNMLTSEFSPLLPSIAGVLDSGGEAVFSGILVDELGDLESGLRAAGFEIISSRYLEEWAAVRVRVF